MSYLCQLTVDCFDMVVFTVGLVVSRTVSQLSACNLVTCVEQVYMEIF